MSSRAEILDEVKQIICKDRNTKHGAPENLCGAISEVWGTYLRRRGVIDPSAPQITPYDVAVMMVLFKTMRFAANPMNHENAVDMTGYSAIAGELTGA